MGQLDSCDNWKASMAFNFGLGNYLRNLLLTFKSEKLDKILHFNDGLGQWALPDSDLYVAYFI